MQVQACYAIGGLSQIYSIYLHKTPWWLIFALGIILPSIFLCLAKSLEYAGIVKLKSLNGYL